MYKRSKVMRQIGAPKTGETDKWIQPITTYGSTHKQKFLQEPVLW